jgi:two-component system response regulator NreC
MSDRIRVLLVEDHTLVRKGICSLLEAEADIEVAGEAENGHEALQKVQALNPQVVLMDITMPSLNGLEATRQIKKQYPHIHVLILTMHTDEEYIFQVLQAGASGYLIKQAELRELVSAIRTVHRGELVLSPSISKTVIENYARLAREADVRDSYDQLSDREREVLQLIAEGYGNREISEQLFVSVKTVEAHKSRIMSKLEINNMAQLVKYAIRKGLTSLDE